MKIYGQTNDLIVREMTSNDTDIFLMFMTERGLNEDFTTTDIKNLWDFRRSKGDTQCVITSIDGGTVYGFCGILKTPPGHYTHKMGFFDKYNKKIYRQQVNEIMLSKTFEQNR